MVFQNYALWPHMTVYENVAFGLEAAGVKNPELDKGIKSALETVQLSDFQTRSPMSLSGGQQQRVALARALAVNPQVLLLDEPLSNLDAKLRDSMRVEIRRICKERNLTAIYVTHDRREALSMADRIAVIDKGAVQQIGSPEDIYRRPANRFVAGFLGDCNFISGSMISSDGDKSIVKTAIGELTSACKVPSSGNVACVMIRPEGIILDKADGSNTFEGTVEGGVPLGEISSWNISAGGCRLVATELGIGRRMQGDKCRFSIDPGNVVLLP